MNLQKSNLPNISQGNKNTALGYLISTINVMLYVAMVAVNALANLIPFNGKTTGEVSNSLTNLFAPAGSTFAIWGVIYILLPLYVVSMFNTPNTNNGLSKYSTKLVFGLTCVLNGSWLVAWHYELFVLSLVIMIFLLLSLIYLFIQNNNTRFLNSFWEFSIKTSISIYLAWISVATIANFTAVLVYYNWHGFGLSQNIYTIILIAVGAALALTMLIQRKNIAFALVFIWAYNGIIIKRLAADVVHSDIIYACYLSIGILAITIVPIAVLKLRNRKQPTTQH